MMSLRRFVLFIVFCSLLIGLTSCSEKANMISECPLTIDTVKVLLTKRHNNREFYLVKRISGWHDKVVFIQLFDQEPVMGACNEDLVKPMLEGSIDMEKPLAKVLVDLEREMFQFVYNEMSVEEKEIALEFVQ